MTDKPFEFKKGDIAEHGGVRGVVIEVEPDRDYPVKFIDESKLRFCFTLNGRAMTHHTKPLLILIERPKQRVKKKGWIGIMPSNVSEMFVTTTIYTSRDLIKDDVSGDTFNIQEIEFYVDEE